MDKFLPTWGEKLIAFLYVIGIGLAVYLPFLEMFSFTPLVTFVHRFSITLPMGSDSKTLQVLLFIIPILLYKSLREYHKRYGISSLLKNRAIQLMLPLVVIDLIYTIFSTHRFSSLSIFGVRLFLYSVFISSAIWLKMIFDGSVKENLLKVSYKAAQIFVLCLGIFSVVNGLVSIHQFLDCSVFNNSCTVWSWVDRTFPNKLLEVGHQKFNDDLNLIRSPGFFGDVNFNGIFAMLCLVIFGTLLFIDTVNNTRKGHSEKRNRILLAIFIIVSLITYILTISRSALLGLIPIGSILGIFYIFPILKVTKLLPQTAKYSWRIILVLVVLLGFLLGIGTGIHTSTKDGKPGSTITEEVFLYARKAFMLSDSSANDHVRLFDIAVQISQKNNFLGWGIGTFKYSYATFIDPTTTNADPHSAYGTLLAEEGLPGLIVYLVFICFIWYQAFRMMFYAKEQVVHLLKTQKTSTKETYMKTMILTFLTLMGFAFPFMSLATITYYGFFLPMSWWWGSITLITLPQKSNPVDLNARMM